MDCLPGKYNDFLGEGIFLRSRRYLQLERESDAENRFGKGTTYLREKNVDLLVTWRRGLACDPSSRALEGYRNIQLQTVVVLQTLQVCNPTPERAQVFHPFQMAMILDGGRGSRPGIDDRVTKLPRPFQTLDYRILLADNDIGVSQSLCDCISSVHRFYDTHSLQLNLDCQFGSPKSVLLDVTIAYMRAYTVNRPMVTYHGRMVANFSRRTNVYEGCGRRHRGGQDLDGRAPSRVL